MPRVWRGMPGKSRKRWRFSFKEALSQEWLSYQNFFRTWLFLLSGALAGNKQA
jgi:hypothetical protein